MINMAVLGAGNWGRNHIRTLSGMDNVRLKSVCDIDEERLKRINENYPNIEITNDPKDIFKDSSIKGVVVASSSDAHFSLAKSALDNDKDVLVEKPLTLDSNSAEILIEKAEEKKRILMVGHLLVYHPAVKKIKELMKSGELGEIYYLYSQRINLGAIRRTESSLWSLGPHDISIALYLLEEVPNFVEAYGESYIQKDVNDVVFLNLHFPNRIIANIHISWLDPHKIRKLTIVGSKKMVVFDDMEAIEKIKVYDKGVDGIDYNSFSEYISLRFGDVLIPKLEMYEPLKLEDAHFVECIQKRIKPITDGENGLKVIKILEEAEKSLRNK